jgi:hypothetical protein
MYKPLVLDSISDSSEKAPSDLFELSFNEGKRVNRHLGSDSSEKFEENKANKLIFKMRVDCSILVTEADVICNLVVEMLEIISNAHCVQIICHECFRTILFKYFFHSIFGTIKEPSFKAGLLKRFVDSFCDRFSDTPISLGQYDRKCSVR